MVDVRSSPRTGPVLCFVFDTRYAGYAALDGFGLAPSGFRSVTVKHRSQRRRNAWQIERLTLAIARFRPSTLVLGMRSRCRALTRWLRKQLRALAARLQLPLVERNPNDAVTLLLGTDRSRRGALGQTLVRHFRLDDALPKRGRGSVNLNARIAKRGERARCHRAAWQATALALMELTETRPFTAGALVREGIRLPEPYRSHLTAAANRI